MCRPLGAESRASSDSVIVSHGDRSELLEALLRFGFQRRLGSRSLLATNAFLERLICNKGHGLCKSVNLRAEDIGRATAQITCHKRSCGCWGKEARVADSWRLRVFLCRLS